MSRPSGHFPSRLVVFGELLLRGLLALAVVKLAPRTFWADIETYFNRARDVGFGHLPYRDFLWEYPPLSSLPLSLIPLTGRTLTGFFIAFVTLTVLVEFLCLLGLRRAKPEHAKQITVFWTIAVVPLATITWFRMDVFVTAFAVLALLAMVRERSWLAATVGGFAAKLWPVIFFVPMLLQRRWRDIAIGAVACAAVVGGWYLFAPEGFEDFMRFRKGDGFQVESIPGSLLLLSGRPSSLQFGALVVSDAGYEWVHTVLNACLLGIPLAAVAVAWRRGADQVALLGALTCTLLLTTRLLSPQFLMWLAPFVVWLLPQWRRQAGIYLVSIWLTLIVITFYGQFLRHNLLVDSLLVARNAVMLVLLVELFRVAFRRPVAEPASN